MQIFIRSHELHCLEASGSESVGDIRNQIAAAEGLCEEDVVLYCAGAPLQDEQTLASCTANMSTLEVEVRLLGGKVHGSLARAGKVKGQTPKVDKQEKKKKRTGRAKRRMQYNRRFVNVVAGFGKRKGPNSNS